MTLVHTQLRLTVVALTVLVASPVRADTPVIEVTGADFRPFPVAVPDVTVQGAGGKAGGRSATELTAIVRDGVNIVRALELVSPSSYLAPKDEPWTAPVYDSWSNVGASGLVRAVVESKPPHVVAKMRFYDVVSQRELLSRIYVEKPANISRAAHKFLDELVELLTGQKGIFSSKLAYVQKTKQGKAIFVSDYDGRNVRRITDPKVISLLPSWDNRGGSVLFTSYLKSNPDIYRYNIKTKKLEWLSNKRGLNTGAAVSPNGKRIALTLSIDGNTEIYVMDSKGNNLKRLTDNWGEDVSPTWSPDGSRIAFVSSRAGNPHIYVMAADGSQQKRLTFQGNYNQEPDWSPKAGGQIVFTARDERLKYDIFAVDPGSGSITRLTQDEGNNESPSYSPDGNQIVFTSTRAGGKKIFVMDVDGRNQRAISKGGGYETPAWSPAPGYPER
ncbi:MAG: Tol-Pal system beta propeller repeat protein TolB [Myxococcota bacterium]